MERNIVLNEIIYDRDNNTLKVYSNTNDSLSDLSIIGIRRVSNVNEVLKYNELGLYNNMLKVGDGITSFNILPSISVEVIDSLISTSTTQALSANQGKVLKDEVDNIKELRGDSNTFGLVKTSTNINSDNGVISINNASTSTKGVVQLSNSIDSESSEMAATSKAIKDVYDIANTEFIGATEESNGSKGIVPAPSISDKDKFLKGDKTWGIPYIHPTYTSFIGNPTNNQTPSFGSTFTISQIITNNTGHISSINDRTITIPDTLANPTNINGLMSSSDKSKLDSIETNANNYILPAATSTILGGIKIGSNISKGDNDEIYLSNANVLAALNKSTDTTKYLRNDGIWATPPDNNTTYDVATTDTAGLMSASDKSKLNSVDFNANYIVVDSSISDNSTNPIQNKVVKSYIDTSISNLIDDAPNSLNTLQKIATAIGEDSDFINTINDELDTKVDKVNGKQLSTNDYTTIEKNKLAGISESADNVSFTRSLNSGTKIGTITINDTSTDIYSTNDTTYNLVTTTSDGLMSKSDKSKLDSIEDSANNYVLPKATSSVLGGVIIGNNITTNSTTGEIFITNSNVLSALNKGTDTTKFLNNSGTWTTPENTTYNEATTSISGLMSSSDKSKLDSIEANATRVLVDSVVSDASTNTIQNKVIKSYVDTKISDLVGSAPDTLDTLQELAEALGEDKNFSTTITTELGKKVDKVTGKQLSTNDFTNTYKSKLDGITDSADSVSFTRTLNNGTKIGTITINGSNTDIYSTNDTTYDLVSSTNDGIMSSSDKSKLDSIEDSANNYVHPSYTARTGKPTTNQSVVLGNTITISQITSDTSGHVTNATDRTITFTHPTYTATTGIESANQTPAFGSTFNISQVVSDSTGHISSQTTRTVKIPNSTVTASSDGTGGSNGLMLATDKEKLDGIATNANNYSHPTYTAKTGNPTANQTPGFGGSFTVTQFTSNSTGHISAATDRTITIPNSVVTTTTNGLMSSTDKTKLDGIANNANNYVHHTQTALTGKPSTNSTPNFGDTFTISQVNVDSEGHTTSLTDRTVTIPNTVATSSNLGLVKIGSNINVSSGTISVNSGSTSQAGIVQLTDSVSSTSTTTAATPKSVKTAYDLAGTVFTGADGTNAGVKGIVPAPTKTDNTKYLKGDGTWSTPYTHPSYTATTGIETANQTPAFGATFNISQVVSDSLGHISSQTTRTVKIPNTTVTTTTNGLMLSTDKSKLDGIANNANNYVHPTYTARTGEPTADATPNFGETFTISQITSDTSGHVTNATNRTITIPNTLATSSNIGLVKVGSNINVSEGTISVNTGSTSQTGVLQLTDGYTSTSTTTAATANSVKSAYDTLNSAKLNISDLIDNLITDSSTSAINATQSKLILKELSKIVQSLGLIECTFLHPNDCIDTLNSITEIEPSMPMSGVLALKLENQISKLVQVVSMLTTALFDTDIYTSSES